MSNPLASNERQPSVQATPRTNGLEPLCSLSSVESIPLLKACIAPSAAIAQYQQAMQWSSFSEPYARWMSVLEAVAMQQLSGTPADAADALIAQGKDNAYSSRLMEVLNERDNYYATQDVDATVALHIASAISPREVSLRRRAANQGELMGLPADYAAPSGAERLQHLLNDWQQFVGRGAADMHPLLLVGLAHCQFVCMRPFTFANTSTAQILNQILLAEEGVLDRSLVLPLAWQFSHRSSDYWQLQVDAATSQNFAPWLMFFLQKLTDSAERCAYQLHRLEQHRDNFLLQIEEHLPSMSNAPLLAAVCTQPSCSIGDIVEAGVAKRQTAAIYLSKLTDAGLLRECRVGKEKRFVNDSLLTLLIDE